jgi:hypothetical protein
MPALGVGLSRSRLSRQQLAIAADLLGQLWLGTIRMDLEAARIDHHRLIRSGRGANCTRVAWLGLVYGAIDIGLDAGPRSRIHGGEPIGPMAICRGSQ